jgi:hypothetical protein
VGDGGGQVGRGAQVGASGGQPGGGVPDDGVRDEERGCSDGAEPVHQHHQPSAAAWRVPQRLLPGLLRHARVGLRGLLPWHGPPHGHR